MPLIEPGRKAPAFTLKDQHGTTHRLADYAGRALVLYFYPKDDTSGCTAQACDFRDQLPKFAKMECAVLGVSILNTKSKARFADKHGINFPILADDALNEEGKPDPKVAKKYGVWGEKSMYGKKYMGIERTTYLIDGDGRVVRRWDKVKVPGHGDEVLGAVRELG
ncbi:MAG: thioredoxin-dependent thiol peroxidase [Phycisphaerales bacterium]